MYSFFRAGSPSGRKPFYNVHTPSSYSRVNTPAARRQLFTPTPAANPFTTPTSTPPPPAQPPLPTTPAATYASNIDVSGSSAQQFATSSSATDLRLPWNHNFKNVPSSIFSKSPPSLSYPTGSTDENKNLHFIRSALGYLRSSSYVRDVLDWDPRPHPFYHLESLKQFVATQGFPDYTFDPSQTLATIHWVESKSPEFVTELSKILNFGGTVSYGNIIEQIYHTVYS